MRLRPAWVNLATPVAVLVAAFILVPYVNALPASLAGLKVYGTYIILALGVLVSLAFRRGRVLFALLSLAIAYVGYRFLFQHGMTGFTARTVFVALCVFVPFNLAALSVLQERGAFNLHGLQRLGVILLEVAFTAWIVLSEKTETTDWAYAPMLDIDLLVASPIPQMGLATMTMAVAAGIAMWVATRSAIVLGLAGAIVAFGIAANGIATPNVFPVFIAAGALMLTIAVLQDTFRMAFRDELTGLPSRRALNERLAGLGRSYTVAMVDVDHFKDLNDSYGHDVGDQVLKMVAAQLAQVGGGGRAYRYGGEEFTLLFPGAAIEQVLPHLEALRKEIANHPLALRKPDRPAQTKAGKKRRGARDADKSASVRVSIGVAERNERLATPADVIQAADKALYRAKRKGRNQVSR